MNRGTASESGVVPRPAQPSGSHMEAVAAAPSVADRFAWSALRYPVPPGANRLGYMLGGITFVAFLLLVLTGLVLDQFYDPNALGAHDSVVYLMTRVPLGAWLRGVHLWAATSMLITVQLHLIWVFWHRGYRAPREVTWWTGVLLLLVVFGLAFTGTALRADQEAGEALAHAVEGAERVGVFGAVLTEGFTQSTSLLARVHNMHVSLLPLALVALVAGHFWLIRHLGMSVAGPKSATFAEHARRLGGFGLLLTGAIAAAAWAFVPGIGYPAVAGTEVTKPFWPFLWIYTFENLVGITGILIAPAALFGFLLLVPVLDRGTGPRRMWVAALAWAMLIVYLVALVWGFLARQQQHIGM